MLQVVDYYLILLKKQWYHRHLVMIGTDVFSSQMLRVCFNVEAISSGFTLAFYNVYSKLKTMSHWGGCAQKESCRQPSQPEFYLLRIHMREREN